MNPRLFDASNHVPDVYPKDSWGDPEPTRHEPAPGTVLLPTRRSVVGRVPVGAKATVGLRIGVSSGHSTAASSSRQFEVQEIAGNVIRLNPEIESPPRIEPRLIFHERRVQAKQPKKLNRLWLSVKRFHNRAPRWILAMGLMVTAMVVSGLMVLPAINAPNAPRSDPGRMVLSVVEEQEVEGMEPLTALLAQQTEALRIFRLYAQASGIDEITPLVRGGKYLEEVLRAHWKPLGFAKSWVPDADSEWGVVELGGRPFGQLAGNFPDGSKYTAYFTNDDGRLLLDWKATVGFGTASFAQLGDGSGDGREIRGELSAAHYYNSTWPEADYQSYSLASPDLGTKIWCYARRGEAPEDALGSLFNQGVITGESQTVQKATLRLARGPGSSMPNQWAIRELLHIDWATP